MPRHPFGCVPSDHPAIDRRTLVRAGGLTLIGAGLSDLLWLETQAAQTTTIQARAKSVVFIWANGGPSQHETWDPKPLAPDTVRGEYNPIQTRVGGLDICEYLPKLAQRADKYAIVRTMHHTAERQFRNEHAASQYMVNTGTCELPTGENTNTIALPKQGRFEWPSMGSMIAYALPPVGAAGLPPLIHVPRPNQAPIGVGPGVLGPRYAPWIVDVAPPCHSKDAAGSCPNCFSHDQPDDPERAPGKGPKAWWDNSSCRDAEFHPPDLGLPEGLSIDRIECRSELLAQLDAVRRSLDRAPSVEQHDAFRRQALQLIVSQRGAQNPFDISQEPAAVRELYSRQEWGNGFLLARRLVEAGVRMVQINLRGWDTHQNAFRDLKGKLLPSIDHSLSGFLDDLEARGLLDETLVVMCGEMGRTPIISPIAVGGINAAGVPFTPGRHHWGDIFPCFFAGGGIRPGQVIGRSDSRGGVPDGEAYTPEDLAATIFHLLGIGPDREFHDGLGRPFRVYRGKPIAPLL